MTSRADLYAIALIAASKAMNVDPIAALTVKGHEARKALYPAALGVFDGNATYSSLARSFGFSRSGFQAWCRKGWDYRSPSYAAYKAAHQALLGVLR